jgi:hypothetical protein
MTIKEKKSIQQSIEELIAIANFIEKPDLNAPSEKTFKRIENETGFKLPSEYKLLLQKTYNLYYGTIEPFAIDNSNEAVNYFITAVNTAKSLGVPENWLPICEDNGDYYCLLYDGSVHFWDHNGASEESWDSLATWVKQVWIQGN